MTDAKQRIPLQTLRYLVPINELTQDNMRDLADKTWVERLGAGRSLFKKGEQDNLSYYLLSGEIALDDGENRRAIVGGTNPSRFPLDHHRPRQATATAVTDIQFIRIDNDLLDILLTWDQNAGYMVTEIDEADDVSAADDNDWMTHMLRSNLFHKIPPTNIQAIFMRMEAIPYSAGDVVIRQGDEGDYYYYMKSGRALVTRDSTKSGKTLKLAELNTGSSFGEEALISGARRNANVTMLTDGVLMRLGKSDFDSLLKGPVMRSVGYDAAAKMVEDGEALWLDVRLESEHKNSTIPNSLNIPLYLLRIKAAQLGRDRKYIVFCDTGRRSASAAYLMSERGFEAYVLEGGLMSVKQAHTSG